MLIDPDYEENYDMNRPLLIKYEDYKYGIYNKEDYVYDRHHKKIKPGHEIMQIDLDTGEVIKLYPSASEAARELGIDRRNIANAANKIRRTAGGYFWMWKDEHDTKFIDEPYQKIQNVKCSRMNLDTGDIEVYSSIRKIIEATGISYRVLMHHISYGIPWKRYLYRMELL